jgi:dipeptidyl aminopeptidase/acylaminoacyl peptidase
MPRKPVPIQADDIYRIQQPTTCRLSPDGRNVAVVVSRPDKETLKNLSHIWMVPTDGEPARPFTQGKGGDSRPRFSPDGRTLAFLSARSGKTEIWTMPTDGGEAKQLTKLGGLITEFEFSPNGRKLAIVYVPQDPDAKEREEKKKRGEPGAEAPAVRTITRLFYKLDGMGFIPKGRFHIWIVDVETGKAKALTTDDRYDESSPAWSPDGRWIYFNSNRTANPDFDLERVSIWKVRARGGEVERVRTFDGPSTNFSISPDGQWIAFLGHDDADAPWNTRHTKLWLVPAGGGRPIELAADLDRGCDNSTINDTFGTGSTPPPVWSPDSQWVYFVVSSEGSTQLWRSQIRLRKATPVITRLGVIVDYDIHFPTRTAYASFADTHTPGEVRAFSGPEMTMKTMTSFNEWLDDRIVVQPEEFWFEGKGRHKLQGWILPGRTRATSKGPAVLYIHGGPATQYGRVFFHEFQYLAGKGYTVFYSNPRGGTGYSQKHLAAIFDAWGTVDYDDLMKFTDEALRRAPRVDRHRIGVAGGSYGGYMTNWIIGHTPRFGAAITSRSVVNLISFAGSSDFGYAWWRVFGGKIAWRDPAHYLSMSPISYIDAVRTPTLIEHQERDDRCPIEQAEQLFAALKARGVPVEFHRYPDESHGMSRGGRPDRRIERLERISGWFDRWLVRHRKQR